MHYRTFVTALFATLAVAAPTQMHDRGFFSDIGDAVSSGLGDVVGAAKDVGSDVVSGAKDVGSAVSSGAEDVGGAVATGAKAVGNFAANLANCDVLKCAAALGPTAASCGTAVAKFVQDNPEIAEVAEDAAVAARRDLDERAAAGAKAGAVGCLAGLGNTIANPPAACGKCF